MITPFGKTLSEAREKVEGGLAISLIGLDGIAVETQKVRDDVPVESLAAELGSFVRSIRLTNTELHLGGVEQFSLVTDRYVTFLSEVTEEYYVLFVLDRNGNYGRARYELSRLKHKLKDELV
jgi:predicted regulator of Ras-like GTPase activity (Roadblock/LC7/MglB family)